MPDIHAKFPGASPTTSPAQSRPRDLFLSIRARLIVVALVAIAPLMIERMRGLERARADRAELARAEVLDLARGGASTQREIIYSMRAMLQVVAKVYAKMPSARFDCSKMLADLGVNAPWIYGFAVAGTDGRVVCSTDSCGIGLYLGDRPYFENAFHSRDFALSDYLIGRLHGVPGLVATYPILKDDGSVDGIVMASINLQWIGDLAAKAAQRAGTAVTLIDGNGRLIAGSADQTAYIGKSFAAHELVHDMLANDEGTMTTAGFDGVRRIFAYVRVPWTQARLAVGFDESVVHGGIEREISIAYLQL
jgi:hypothetical protein